MTLMRSIAPALLLVLLVAASARGADTTASAAQADSLRRSAYDAAYNMDYEQAVELFRQAAAANADDPATLRGVASVAWLRILFLRGTVLVEDYAGRVRSSDVRMPDPPADLDKVFQESITKAIALAEKAVDARYNNPSAHYELSASLGIAASYAGTIRGSVWSGMKLARRAVSEGQIVLKLDKSRKEAGLVVGTYRYLVSMVPFTLRWLAYIIGFEGGKDEGIRQIEEAANHPSDVQTDARFALVLLYNREKRYDEAVTALRSLERSFPRNRLLRLEEAATLLRGKRSAEALQVIDLAMAELEKDSRPRMFGEDVRWLLKRGSARLQVGMLNEAEADLSAALRGKEARRWVLARVHVELGKLADVRGDRAKARTEFATAVSLASAAGDDDGRLEAVRLQSEGYRK
jgi:tetratricopeptide (TPR) repeat protein